MEPVGKKAVFLSYSSHDGAAAHLIAESLRDAGVEVWFDLSELRAGDAWDAKIRKQVRECALFIPVISADTNSRTEGYFRREWNLAAARMLDMASDASFVIPVMIEPMSHSEARVPPEFLRMQWTSLPGGKTPPEFASQIRGLLGGTVAPRKRIPVAPSAAPEPRRKPQSRIARAIAAVAIVALVAFGGWRLAHPGPSGPPLNGRVIAVLPFVNMGGDRENTEFADGIHEDILTYLASVGSLKVVSRTTVVQFRDSKKTLREIGAALGVGYVVEGSVRTSGNTIKLTIQVIDARTDAHVWARNYRLTVADRFTDEDDLAQEIAKAMASAIPPGA